MVKVRESVGIKKLQETQDYKKKKKKTRQLFEYTLINNKQNKNNTKMVKLILH